MEAPLSQLKQCWLPATAPPVPEATVVLLPAFRSLLYAISMHKPAECSAFQKSGDPSLSTADSRVLWVRVQQGKSFCSLMTQTRSEASQQQSNTLWHSPSLNRDPSFSKGELPLALPINQGRQEVAN